MPIGCCTSSQTLESDSILLSHYLSHKSFDFNIWVFFFTANAKTLASQTYELKRDIRQPNNATELW